MMVSTKGRYALRVMIDLAEHGHSDYIPLKEIAERQEISLKYLEGIIKSLTTAGLLKGLRGKGGGYKLTRLPSQYTAGDILRLTEGSLAPVACLSTGKVECPHATECHTIGMWEGLYKLINEYLDSITLEELLHSTDPGNHFVI